MHGGYGHDLIDGGGDADYLIGSLGNDTLDGNTGFDRCWDGPGSNTLTRCERFGPAPTV